MFKNFLKLAIGALVVLTFIGCDSKTVSNPVEKISAEVTIPNDSFSDGVVEDNVYLPVTSPDGTTIAKIVIPDGTIFTDANGNPVSEPPKTAVEVEKAPEVTKVELKFVDKNGNPLKIEGDKAIEAKVPAPTNAKPGDRVEIEVPDGVDAAANSINEFKISAKLITATVGSDGFISLKILPSALSSGAIIVEVKLPTITGGDGA